MSLDNYDNLKTTIINFSGRDDLSQVIGDFITLAESNFYANSISPLRIRSMEANNEYSLSTSSRFLALPTDFLEMRSARITVGDYKPKLMPVTPNNMDILPGTGIPSRFTVTDQIEFNILPDIAYTVSFQYYNKLTALSDANTTNDILTNHPNIYLYGALTELYNYSSEEEKATYNNKLFIDAINGANREAVSGRYGPSPRARVAGSHP